MSWRALPGEEDSTKTLRESLDKVSKKLGGSPVHVTENVFGNWDSAVGEQIASHTKPVSLKSSVLTIEVDDPRWATQLKWLSSQVLAKLNESNAESPVTKLEVRLKRY